MKEKRVHKNRFIRRLPGRLRMYIHGLKGNGQLARLMEHDCLSIPGVKRVMANMDTSRILVLFAEDQLDHQQLEQHLLEIEGLFGKGVEIAAAGTEQPEIQGTLALQEQWHSLQAEEILHHLQSDDGKGLSVAEVEYRRRYFGENRMSEGEPPDWYRLFFRQFFNFTTLTMVSIASLPIFLGRIRDTVGVLFILGLNAVIGTYQEWKAQQDIRALKQLAVFKGRVIRSGVEMEVLAEELVPGDILLLQAGDRVPADGILLESWNVEADESTLTGESVPVAKTAAIVSERDTPLAERKNMVYMGTSITRGRAKGVVVATGHQTEIGMMARMLQHVKTRPTPLQHRLNVVARTLVIAALVIAGGVVAVRWVQGFPLIETLMTGVSVATTAISEGLPIMITVALVAGMRRMVRHQAVVRKLSALETLAKVDVICSDKTGTLTKNEMTVRQVIGGEQVWTVTGEGYQLDGCFLQEGKQVPLHPHHDLIWFATLASLCNDATLLPGGKASSLDRGHPSDSHWIIQGDPTEGALLIAAAKAGIQPDICKNQWERVMEFPFDSQRRRMTVVCRNLQGDLYVITKGSVDVVLERCTYVKKRDGMEALDLCTRTGILQREKEMAGQAMRVLAVAYKRVEEDLLHTSADQWEKDMTFAAMFAMIDPPREDVKESLAACREADIQVVLLTGDHPQTAAAIGKELGIIDRDDQVMTGRDLSCLTDEELIRATERVRIFSRVSPGDKQRIVSALQKRGLVVAMAGDGVNDVPALKQADVGIALGSGTDAAKEVSSLVLTDDHFSTIVKAIRQGRSVLGNIRSTIGYIFTGNLSEVLYASLSVAAGLPLPLMPLQMMFMNLLTDSLPTMVMTLGRSLKKKERVTQQLLPKVRDIFDPVLKARVAVSGILVGFGTTALYMGAIVLTGNPPLAATMALSALCLGKLAQVPYWRQVSGEGEQARLDPMMAATLGISTAGLLMAIYIPKFRSVFNSVPLGLHHWGFILATVYVGKQLAQPLADWILSKLKNRIDPHAIDGMLCRELRLWRSSRFIV